MTPAYLNQIAAFARGLNTHVERELEASFGRSLSELTALVSIQNCDQFHIGWLAQTLSLQHSSAVRVVDRLEKDGLIARLDKDAKKQVGLKITKAGATLAKKILALRAKATESYLSAINSEQQSALAAIIEPVITARTTSKIELYQYCALCDDGACTNCPAGVESTD